MADLRLSDIAGMTGFSLRYWQRLAFNGELPGAYFIDMRGRRRYFVEEKPFMRWWEAQRREITCRRTFENGAASRVN